MKKTGEAGRVSVLKTFLETFLGVALGALLGAVIVYLLNGKFSLTGILEFTLAYSIVFFIGGQFRKRKRAGADESHEEVPENSEENSGNIGE